MEDPTAAREGVIVVPTAASREGVIAVPNVHAVPWAPPAERQSVEVPSGVIAVSAAAQTAQSRAGLNVYAAPWFPPDAHPELSRGGGRGGSG